MSLRDQDQDKGQSVWAPARKTVIGSPQTGRRENEARIAAPSDGGGRLSTAIELGSCQLVTNTNIIPGYESI